MTSSIESRPTRARGLIPLAVGACFSAALLGCGPMPDSDTVATQAPESQTSDAAPETHGATPGCDTMNPLAASEHEQFVLRASDEAPPARAESTLTHFMRVAGPQARAAMDAAVTWQGCTWPVDFHRAVTQYTAELPQTATEQLQSELRDARYPESTLGPATVFTTTESSSEQPDAATDVTYLFVDEMWITILDNSPANFAQSALEGLAETAP